MKHLQRTQGTCSKEFGTPETTKMISRSLRDLYFGSFPRKTHDSVEVRRQFTTGTNLQRDHHGSSSGP